MLHYYNLDTFYNTIKEWYDGYLFGKTDIYCPWDVINYCDKLLADKEHKPEAFWSNSSSNSIIQSILSQATETTKNQIELLISGEAIEQKIIPELTYTDLDNDDITIRETYLWSVMYATGYLTKNPEAGNGLYKLKIPNKEIAQIYHDKIRSWYNTNIRRDIQKLQEFCEAVKAGNATQFQTLFNSYMCQSISIRDTFAKKELKENFYHGLLLGILQCNGNWVVRSNQEAGLGYGDILIQMPHERIGCVIELKYAENGSFDTACNEALRQISTKNYTSYFQQENIKTIYSYGVACYKKSCKIICRQPGIS